MFEDTPRSSSPIIQRKFKDKSSKTNFSFPVATEDSFFQETGDSTRSLLAPIYAADDSDCECVSHEDNEEKLELSSLLSTTAVNNR